MRRGKLAALLLSLAALLLTGCSAGSTSGTASAGPSAGATPWILNATGNAAPSPSPTFSVSPPTPFPTGFLPVSSTAATATATASATCDPIKFNAGTINGLAVVPSATSATVSWYNPGGADLVEYRITAISQGLTPGPQRDVGWTVVTPGTACTTMSAPITGLDRKTYYIFSVDAVFKNLGDDGTNAATIARSTYPVQTL
jgi:hypothetical protein